MTGHIHIASIDALRLIKSRLREITEEEATNLELLGQPSGESLEHCIFMGLKYCPNFATRVKYYIERKELPKADYRNAIKAVAHEIPHKLFFVDFYTDKGGV
jgi:hypothetical protein